MLRLILGKREWRQTALSSAQILTRSNAVLRKIQNKIVLNTCFERTDYKVSKYPVCRDIVVQHQYTRHVQSLGGQYIPPVRYTQTRQELLSVILRWSDVTNRHNSWVVLASENSAIEFQIEFSKLNRTTYLASCGWIGTRTWTMLSICYNNLNWKRHWNVPRMRQWNISPENVGVLSRGRGLTSGEMMEPPTARE